MLDADIRDFFGQLDRAWLRTFLEHRIVDERDPLRTLRWSGGMSGSLLGKLSGVENVALASSQGHEWP